QRPHRAPWSARVWRRAPGSGTSRQRQAGCASGTSSVVARALWGGIGFCHPAAALAHRPRGRVDRIRAIGQRGRVSRPPRIALLVMLLGGVAAGVYFWRRAPPGDHADARHTSSPSPTPAPSPSSAGAERGASEDFAPRFAERLAQFAVRNQLAA